MELHNHLSFFAPLLPFQLIFMFFCHPEHNWFDLIDVHSWRAIHNPRTTHVDCGDARRPKLTRMLPVRHQMVTRPGTFKEGIYRAKDVSGVVDAKKIFVDFLFYFPDRLVFAVPFVWDKAHQIRLSTVCLKDAGLAGGGRLWNANDLFNFRLCESNR